MVFRPVVEFLMDPPWSDVRHPSDKSAAMTRLKRSPSVRWLKVEKIYVETFPFDATKELMTTTEGIGEVPRGLYSSIPAQEPPWLRLVGP
jgi:hypothetical protein